MITNCYKLSKYISALHIQSKQTHTLTHTVTHRFKHTHTALPVWHFPTGHCNKSEESISPWQGQPFLISSSRQCDSEHGYVCVCEGQQQLSAATIQRRLNVHLTLIVSLQIETHLQCSSRHMPAAQTGYHALPTAAARALNLMFSKCSRIQADNETRYPLPSMPCSSGSQGLQLLAQEMHHWQTCSRTLSLPLILFFLPAPRPANVKARCQPLRKSRAQCPHPLCKWFTTTPTHTFILCLPTIIYSPFI